LANQASRGPVGTVAVSTLYAYSHVSVLVLAKNGSSNQAHTFQIFDDCEANDLVNINNGCTIQYWRGLAKFEVFD
jgi:hypothetical protein